MAPEPVSISGSAGPDLVGFAAALVGAGTASVGMITSFLRNVVIGRAKLAGNGTHRSGMHELGVLREDAAGVTRR
jgi:hypothetical protein